MGVEIAIGRGKWEDMGKSGKGQSDLCCKSFLGAEVL